MGKVYDSITDDLARWLGAQPVFFVATATTDPDTHVNVSPRGLDTFRVLEPNRVAWLDLTGSGVETIAHLRADGRITLMFCAFGDPPQIGVEVLVDITVDRGDRSLPGIAEVGVRLGE